MAEELCWEGVFFEFFFLSEKERFFSFPSRAALKRLNSSSLSPYLSSPA